ncbi:MAG: hypothetical protein IJ551_02555 [Prevotella sp.]|nr:hypothetical protein [Prevotella sp.]
MRNNVSNSLYAPGGSVPSGWSAINSEATFVRHGYVNNNYHCYYTEKMGDAQGTQVRAVATDRDMGNVVKEYSMLTAYENGILFDGTYYMVPVAISLADNEDNTSVLAGSAGKAANVTLADRTLYKDGKWNTLCLPFDVATLTGTPLAGATIMEMNPDKKNGLDASNGTLYLAFKTATAIEAGKPYLVKWESGENIANPVFSNVIISSTTPTPVEAATDGLETVRMVGNYAPVNVEANDQSIMFMGDGSKLYYTTVDRTLRNFRAHFEIPSVQSQQTAPTPARSFVIDFDGEVVTGIKSIDDLTISWTSQALRESNLRFDAEAWYTLDGRRLDGKPTAKGVYIHDGVKVVIK